MFAPTDKFQSIRLHRVCQARASRRAVLEGLLSKHSLSYGGQPCSELVIATGERIAIDPDADFAMSCAMHLVSLPVGDTVH